MASHHLKIRLMKNVLILSFSFFLAFAAFAEKKIVTSKISEVTVYPVGAMVNRVAKVTIPAGSNFIILDNLTHAIDPNTIQVGGTGVFEILSVKFELFYPYAQTKPKGIEAIEDSLKMYQDQRYLLVAENSTLDQEMQLILANKKLNGNNSTVTVAQLDAMAKYYRTQLTNINKEKLRNQNERLKVQAEEKRLNATLAGMNNYKYEQIGRIFVETKSKSATQANIKFSFFTHLAGWNPKYNIKAKTGQENIDVDYHAQVVQNTGVDWNNVDLVLSTSRPTFSNQKPELHPWYLSFYDYRSRQINAQSTYGYGTVQEADMANSNTYYSEGKYKKLEKDKQVAYVQGQTLINALNTSYKIDSKYTVVSNNTKKQVYIKNIKIPATFNHYTVPSMEKVAFLTASLADWSSYDLVPGHATLFYNNTYVGKSYIYSNTTDDTLQISLGRDQGIIINHEKVQDLCNHKRIGGNIKKTFVYEISAKNTNKEEVTMVIMARVPVSKLNEIVVTVGDLAGAEYNKETGILKWKKTIAAGAKVDFRFGYEVKYPKDKQVNL